MADVHRGCGFQRSLCPLPAHDESDIKYNDLIVKDKRQSSATRAGQIGKPAFMRLYNRDACKMSTRTFSFSSPFAAPFPFPPFLSEVVFLSEAPADAFLAMVVLGKDRSPGTLLRRRQYQDSVSMRPGISAERVEETRHCRASETYSLNLPLGCRRSHN